MVIDGLSRFPEVAIVKSTAAEDNIHAFAEIFARHGFPAKLHSDNGAPFNGKDSHLLTQYFKNMGITHITNKSADDPEATGLVEAFMKHLKKVFHTAEVEHEDPYIRMQEHLMQFRGTPHATMKKCPAEILYGRRFNMKLPDLRANPAKERKDVKEARKEDKKARDNMKRYKDASRHVREHDMAVGDLVIIKRKTTKHDSAYDPDPYKVVEVHGTDQRDAQGWQTQDQGQPKVETRANKAQEEIRTERGHGSKE